MSDEARRALGRAASMTDDVVTRTRVLVEAMRASQCPDCQAPRPDVAPPGALARCRVCLAFGSPERSRVALAAVCGDPAALAAFACEHDDLCDGSRACLCYLAGLATHDVGNMATWLMHLERWGTPVQTRAVIAMSKLMVCDLHARGCAGDRFDANAALVIEAAERWVEGDPRTDNGLMGTWEHYVLVFPSGLNDRLIPTPRSHRVMGMYAQFAAKCQAISAMVGTPRAFEAMRAAVLAWALKASVPWPVGFVADRFGLNTEGASVGVMPRRPWVRDGATAHDGEGNVILEGGSPNGRTGAGGAVHVRGGPASTDPIPVDHRPPARRKDVRVAPRSEHERRSREARRSLPRNGRGGGRRGR